MDCRFCKILFDKDRGILRTSKHTITILSDPRLMPGHFLIIPKRHVERLSELTKEERQDLLEEVTYLQEKIIAKLAPGCDVCQHYRPFIPDNKLKVSHLHFHLRPRKLDDELYLKVQIHEKEMFKSVEEGEVEKYRVIFKK
ncbi:MAG: HIT domain-containing protein [Candidatus Paceibacterota bacterium]|jgi:histidine triad (HIT) family protein